MTTPTHIATGYLIAKSAETLGLVDQATGSTLLWWSVIMAHGPDWDVFAFKKMKDHRRNSLLHVPAVWLSAFALSAFAAKILDLETILPLIALAAVNVFVHFVMDTACSTVGIKWFAPFSDKEYSFLKLTPSCPYNIPLWLTRQVILQPILLAEIAIWIIAWVFFTQSVVAQPVQAKTDNNRFSKIMKILRSVRVQPSRIQK